MGVKKIARPINKAKNDFVKWLKDNDAECIDVYEGGDYGFDYYRVVSGFIGQSLYSVDFMIWQGNIKIDYTDEENDYENMSIDEFMELLS